MIAAERVHDIAEQIDTWVAAYRDTILDQWGVYGAHSDDLNAEARHWATVVIQDSLLRQCLQVMTEKQIRKALPHIFK